MPLVAEVGEEDFLSMNLRVRKALESDGQAICEVVVAAFGDTQGREIADLICDLLADRTALPSLSLVAVTNDCVVGHVLFTNASLEDPQKVVVSAILAPLAVHPEYQNQGIGGRLIQEGLRELKTAGVGLVFVLGHPGYYSKYGFSAAGRKGFEAPYAIPPENAGAWMVRELSPGIIGHVSGRVICANALDDPKHWRE